MKKLLAVSCIIMALFASFCAAEEAPGARVLVIPYLDKTWEHKDSEASLTSSVADRVKSSGRYEYVSADKFAENWLKVLTEKERRLFTGDPAEQMRDLKAYRPMFRHEDLGTLQEYKARWGVDLVIVGDIGLSGEDPGSPLILHSEIISMDTGRFYAVEDEFSAEKAGGLASAQAARLLSRSADVMKVAADRVMVPSRSEVGYEVRTVDGNYLQVFVDYSSNRPAPDVQKVDIVPRKPRADGILPLIVKTKEGKPVKFQFFYRGGGLVNMKISADPPQGMGKDEEREETLTMVSAAGYEIRITFGWKGGQTAGIRIEPAANPYGEIK